MSPGAVRERERELAALHAAAQRAARGDGGVVLVEGPAGIGKTALLRAARERAEEAGLATLRATASPLERDLPFGLVRQLLEPALAAAGPEERARLLGGGAARAAIVFATGAPTAAEPDPSHAVLQGLYWLTVALAEPRPLALVVDDLHWADRASLRFLEVLGRRLEGVGVLVVGGIRTGDPDADSELLAALATGPAAQTLRPAPLTTEAVTALLADQLGATPADAFAAAAHDATGGNPFLLGQLARAAEEERLTGTDADAARVHGLGARDVAESVARRLAALGPDATAVAHAGTIVPEPWDPAELTALVRAAVPDGRELAVEHALDRLADADLLADSRRRFRHPLVREAVAARLASAEAGRLHAIAARQAEERGARPGTVAAHLLLAPPAGDAHVARQLRTAAQAAISEGAPDAAIAALRRALAEPPPPDERPHVLLELGELEALVADPAAAGRLEAALRGLPEPGDATARAHAARARLLLLSNMALGLEEFEAGLRDTRDPRLRMRLEALILEATAYDGALTDQRAALLDQGVRDPQASPVMLAHLAQESAYRCEPAATSERLVQAALDGGLMDAVGPDSGTYHLAALAMRHAELPAVVDRLLTAGEPGVRRSGSVIGRWYHEHARALWHLMFGSVADAEAHARTALTIGDEVGMAVVRFSGVVALADILIERGQPADARALLDGIRPPQGVQSGMTWPDRLSVSAELHRLDGRLDVAEEELRTARQLLRDRGWRAPFKAGAGLRLAQVLAQQGRAEEAIAAAEEEAEAARRAGTQGALGAALRARALALEGEERIAQLREAVAVLEAGPMPTERARARADLGDALRAAGHAEEARDVLRAALEEAEERGAVRVAAQAREGLVELGARPRRAAVRGVEALTPSERRVAGLAASGLTNREIAEALFVTRKTVELHLGHAYAKLGIKSRAQLPQELATAPA